ncbi:hypothetical protein OG618_36185 [Kitasatospora sp. NBC_01246]|uniref:hypothetical protein n=1 Tax=Kitasatospora sp. NBC_01246 TaxID=2903570 RepID=UPI002E35A338|nr:hypothetical protein [Kitasatospora sp. NBC_01246]
MRSRLTAATFAVAVTFTAVAAASADSSSAASAAQTAPVAASATADDATPPPAVEDFTYPGASPFPNLKLLRGDGHILLADCNTTTQIQLWSRAVPNPAGGPSVCFRVNGTVGQLTLELPQTFLIQTNDRAVRANLTADGVAQTVDVPKGGITGVGEGVGQKPTMLVELRVTG